MKTILTLVAVVTGLTLLTPSTSQARDHHHHSSRSYSHSCRSCGTSVYRERCVTGRDRHGCPIYSWRTVSHSCRPSRGHGHGHHHGHSHSRGHISLPGIHLDFGGHHRH